MNKFILLVLFNFLLSCSSLDNGKIAPGYFQAFESMKTLVFGYDKKIDAQIIKDIPFASLKVRIGNGPEALMILESINGEELTWVSADEVYLVIKNGKIIKTQGLPNNLSETFTAFDGWQDLDSNKKLTSYLSFRNPELNNLEIISEFTKIGNDFLKLTFDSKQLILIHEKISAESVGWDVTNLYWLDKENFVWKSVQHISPRLPPVHYEITKKPQ